MTICTGARQITGFGLNAGGSYSRGGWHAHVLCEDPAESIHAFRAFRPWSRITEEMKLFRLVRMSALNLWIEHRLAR